MTPAYFLAACLLALPAVVGVSAAVTVVYYERVYLPRISG